MALMRTAIYVRVSTSEQNSQEQAEGLRYYASKHDLKIVREYIDHGISGTKFNRKALMQMMKDAREQKFDLLLLSSLDRLGRNTLGTLTLIGELASNNVQLKSLRENFNMDDPLGKAVLALCAVFSQLERDIISRRIKDSLYLKRLAAEKAGVKFNIGRPPKVTQELVNSAFALRSQGKSLRQIAAILSVSKSAVSRILAVQKTLEKLDQQGCKIVEEKISNVGGNTA